MGDSLSLSMWAGPERFEECMSLVKEHQLYQEALALLLKKEDHYKVGGHSPSADCVCSVSKHANCPSAIMTQTFPSEVLHQSHLSAYSISQSPHVLTL